MTSRLIFVIIFPCCLIALFLAMRGVSQIEFGNEYYYFLGNVSRTFDSLPKIEIPNIPNIKGFQEGGYNGDGVILQVLKKIANFFVNFINVLISLLNVVVLLLNTFVRLLQYLFAVIMTIRDFISQHDPNAVRVIT